MWTSFVADHTDGKDDDDDATITAIEAGMAHVVVLLSNGQAYGWGASRKGQLGEQYQRQKILRDPRRLDVGPDGRRLLPFVPERVILGRGYTVFLRRGGKPVTWGSMAGDAGAEWLFGQGDTAVSGWSSVHVLSGSGSGSSPGVVQSMGRNNHGQFAPVNLPPIRAIAAGSEHCVALTVEGQVIAWGWGEHGNCGEQVDEKGNVIDRWNIIPLPKLNEGTVVKDVAAGCATTFVICSKEEP
jgi:protein ATS1